MNVREEDVIEIDGNDLEHSLCRSGFYRIRRVVRIGRCVDSLSHQPSRDRVKYVRVRIAEKDDQS